MARLNTRPSYLSTSRSTTAVPPSPSNASDQENFDPERDPRRDKRPVMDGHSTGRASLPTPSSEEAISSSTQKRKRGANDRAQASGGEEDEDEGSEEDEEDEEDADLRKFTRYYDPNQDRKKRQQVKRKSRRLDREIIDSRDELVRGEGDGVLQYVLRANNLYKHVKQTGDATIDAHMLVNLTEITHKQAQQLIHGDASTGVDVGEFISKCIAYMKDGGEGNRDAPSPTQTQRRRAPQSRNDEEDDDDDVDNVQSLDWELLGTNACFPYNHRPACPSFLLGPLSVEKKVRVQTQRRARQRMDNAKEARPEALDKTNNATDQNTLTVICDQIHKQLSKHSDEAEEAMFALQDRGVPIDEKAFCKEYRITTEGGPGLFEFVVNPHSFGETVENLFYVSFLIKEGHVGLVMANEDVPTPTLVVKQRPTGESEEEVPRRKDAMKHQAVYSLDYDTWQKLVEAYEIREPMIKHRGVDGEVPTQGSGWRA